MLRALSPEPQTAAVANAVPNVVLPLVEAGTDKHSITQALQTVAGSLTFDSFMFGVTASSQPTHESRAYVWTSLPEEWVRLYDERAYIESDPRLQGVRDSLLPLIWDRRAFPDSAQNREFFDAAGDFGVRSGVALFVRNACHAPAVFVLNSSEANPDESRRRYIVSVLGQILLIGSYVRDHFLANVIERCIPAPTEGRPLSKRERECLRLAAQGLTSNEIGAKLGIGERTVHQHFSSLLGKLGAANRREAIARAAAAGLV